MMDEAVDDGLDNLRARTSPDTGTTTYLHDEAGNPIRETRADGGEILRTYDALNRLVAVDYPGDDRDIAYRYDERPNGIGRRTGMTEAAGETEWDYDAYGRTVAIRTVLPVGAYALRYVIGPGGLLRSAVLPIGRILRYAYDAAGRPVELVAERDGRIQPLATDIRTHPLGTIEAFTYGNGLRLVRELDDDGRLARQTVAARQDLAWRYDGAGNVAGIDDLLDALYDQGFDYDT